MAQRTYWSCFRVSFHHSVQLEDNNKAVGRTRCACRISWKLRRCRRDASVQTTRSAVARAHRVFRNQRNRIARFLKRRWSKWWLWHDYYYYIIKQKKIKQTQKKNETNFRNCALFLFDCGKKSKKKHDQRDQYRKKKSVYQRMNDDDLGVWTLMVRGGLGDSFVRLPSGLLTRVVDAGLPFVALRPLDSSDDTRTSNAWRVLACSGRRHAARSACHAPCRSMDASS